MSRLTLALEELEENRREEEQTAKFLRVIKSQGIDVKRTVKAEDLQQLSGLSLGVEEVM